MKNQGFTLIEFLLYVAILIIVLSISGGFLWNIIFGNIKETSYQEVQQNGRFAMTKITQEIRRAAGINSPGPGLASSSLSLSMASTTLNPVTFGVADGKLMITRGLKGPYEITSDRVKVTSLRFTNLSYALTPGTIRVEMVIERFNPSDRMEYAASTSLESTVSLSAGGAAP